MVAYKERLPGAIMLAGGDSKRLGHPKTRLRLGGVTLPERVLAVLEPLFAQITVVTDRPQDFRHLPVRLTGDLLTGYLKSPLRGIHAGLSVSSLPFQFVVACDMPFLNPELILYMAAFAGGYDAVVPCVGEHFQPLHAFYSSRCTAVIEEQVKKERFKIIDFFGRLHIRFINRQEIESIDPGQESFFNLNTWDDFRAARRMLALRNASCVSPRDYITEP